MGLGPAPTRSPRLKGASRQFHNVDQAVSTFWAMAEEPQHVLRMCAESLLTAVARLDDTQTQSPLTGIETGRTIVNPPHPQQSPARLTSTTTHPTGNAAISSSSISGLAAPASAMTNIAGCSAIRCPLRLEQVHPRVARSSGHARMYLF